MVLKFEVCKNDGRVAFILDIDVIVLFTVKFKFDIDVIVVFIVLVKFVKLVV